MPASLVMLASACNASGDPNHATLTISLRCRETGATASSVMIDIGRSDVPHMAMSVSWVPNWRRRYLASSSAAYLVMTEVSVPITEFDNMTCVIIPSLRLKVFMG
jgi:hypothetical protein